MPTLLDEFRAITHALNEAGIEYAVCGGWAMAIHGHPRATKDIDLLILTDDVSRVLPLVREQGFDIEVSHFIWMLRFGGTRRSIR